MDAFDYQPSTQTTILASSIPFILPRIFIGIFVRVGLVKPRWISSSETLAPYAPFQSYLQQTIGVFLPLTVPVRSLFLETSLFLLSFCYNFWPQFGIERGKKRHGASAVGTMWCYLPGFVGSVGPFCCSGLISCLMMGCWSALFVRQVCRTSRDR